MTSPLRGQTTEDTSNRWLLIVDTSRTMQEEAPQAYELAAGLIATGVQQQMEDGDTLGVWTFNDTLHAGEFPLQEWTTNTSQIVAGRVRSFLSAQKNEKDSRLDRITTDLQDVVGASRFITVIVITDGTSPIRGTPFDDPINTSFREWRNQQSKSRLPFVVILRGEEGRLTSHLVNIPPFPLEVPPLPEALIRMRAKRAAVGAQSPVTATRTNTRTVLPPLIVRGKKSATNTPVQVPAPESLGSSDATNAAPSATAIPEPPPSVPTPQHTPGPQAVNEAAGPTPTESASVGDSTTTLAPSTPATTVAMSNVSSEPARTRVWLIAGCALAVAGVMVICLTLLLRRRRTAGASLITRSLDRDSR